MSKRRTLRLSIRWKQLIPFAFIIVLVVAVMLPITNGIITNRVESAADENLNNLVDSVGELIQHEEEDALLGAQFIANLPQVRTANGRPGLIDAGLIGQRQALDFQVVSFYSADYQLGDIPVYYDGPSATRRFQISIEAQEISESLILQVIETGESGSAVAIVPQGSQIIGVAPVQSFELDQDAEKTIVGVVFIAMYIDDDFAAEISRIVGADVAFIKDNAVIVSAINDATGYHEALEADLIPQDGQSVGLNLDDSGGAGMIPQRLYVSPLRVDGEDRATLLIAQSLGEFDQMQDDIQLTVALLGAVIVITSVLFGLGSYLNFARPLTELSSTAQLISDGDLDQRIEFNFLFQDEITDLASAFNRMSGKLRAQYVSLEHEVEERTKELVVEHDKLNKTLDELAIARDEALAANRTKSAFLANMSHELRTPLNSILGYSELVLQGMYGDLNEKQHDRISTIMRNGAHLLELINDILDLSKIEAGRMELRFMPVDLAKVVEDCTRTTEPLARRKGLSLTHNIPEDFPMVRADPHRLLQVLMNLASNAIKFTGEGQIKIYSQVINHPDDLPDTPLDLSKYPRPAALLIVDDTGIGITDKDQDQVFDEFRQADNSATRQFEGTGLGLSITRRLVHMMSGEIWLESALGEGTTFYILLPISTETEESQMT